VVTEISAPGVLGMQVTFHRDNAVSVKFQFDFAWQNLQLLKG